MQGWGFISSLSCLHTFWHAIPTSLLITRNYMYFRRNCVQIRKSRSTTWTTPFPGPRTSSQKKSYAKILNGCWFSSFVTLQVNDVMRNAYSGCIGLPAADDSTGRASLADLRAGINFEWLYDVAERGKESISALWALGTVWDPMILITYLWLVWHMQMGG